MASIDLNLQPLGAEGALAALVVSPGLQASATPELPPGLLELQAEWRRRFLLHHGSSAANPPGHVVDDYSQRVVHGLRHWLQDSSWSHLQRALQLQPGLPLRLRVAESLRPLEQLPWETLPLDRPIWRLPPQDPLLPVAVPRTRRSRFVLLVGQEQDLGLDQEVEALAGLARRGRWQLEILRGGRSTAQALRQVLEAEPGWDGLIYLGHGADDSQGGGKLQLGDGSWISGASLETSLRRAADRGLRLILLNCCSGIDLAHRFLAVGVAWVQVFRDPVPSGAAALFFTRLLRLLETGRPFPQAVVVAAQTLEQAPWAGCRGLLSVYCHPEASNYEWPRASQRLQRRELLLLAGGATLATSLAAPLAWDQRGRQGSTVWRLASWLGKKNPKLLIAQAPERLARRLEVISGGRFRIELADVSALSSSEILLEVNQGDKYECGYADVYYDPVLKPLMFAKAVPFGLSPREQEAWLWYVREGDQEVFYKTLYAKLQVKGKYLSNIDSIPLTCTGGQMGGWFKREVHDLADLKGLRMRIPGLGAEVLQHFGVVTDLDLNAGRIIPPSELTSRIRNNLLDAAEWIGPRDDEQLGLQYQARYYYSPGWWEPSTTTDLFVNRKALAALSEDLRAALQAACSETYQFIQRQYDLENMVALERLQQQGVQLRRFSPALMEAFEGKSREHLHFLSEQDPGKFGYVYGEWRHFRDRIRATIAVTQFSQPDRPA